MAKKFDFSGKSKPGFESAEQEQVCKETQERFCAYIDDYVKEYEMEELEMEQIELRKQQVTKSFDAALEQKSKEHTAWDDIGGGFIKIERDKAKVLLVQNWKVEQIKKFKDDKGELKEQIEFSCDVLNEDGVNVNKKYNTTSYSALRSLKEIFYLRPNTAPVLIRVKKIGDGKSTIYDIEEIRTR